MSDESNSTYYDCHDDYYTSSDDEDDSACPPPIVREDLRRRLRLSPEELSKLGPASDAVVKALREYYLSDDCGFYYGGFVDCLETLGWQPDAKDELVYKPEHNICTVVFDDEDEEEVMAPMIDDHTARVRLIRFRGFIEHQAKRGYQADPKWFKSTDDNLDYRGSESFIDEDSDFTDEQLESICMGFVWEFYFYVNFDNIYAGNVSGIKTNKIDAHGMPDGFKNVEIGLGMGSLFNHIEELEKRYNNLRCPLGPEWVLNPAAKSSVIRKKKSGKKGKKNRGRRSQQHPSTDTNGTRWKAHGVEIDERIAKLLKSLDSSLFPTNATAQMLDMMFSLLSTAATYDPAVASAFIDAGDFKCGTLLLALIGRIHSFASSTGDKQWYIARHSAWSVFGSSVKMRLAEHDGSFACFLENPDDQIDNPATNFFFDILVPELLPFFTSKEAHERVPVLDCFKEVVVFLPQSPLLKLISDKGVWNSFERAVSLGLKQCKMSTSEARASTWDNYTCHMALCNATSIIFQLCAKGQRKLGTGSVEPTELGVKLVKRGVVPMLMKIAKLELGTPSCFAMEALGNISRVRDSRHLLFQDPNSTEFLSSVLSSWDGAIVSPAFLLIIHLLWDEEWIEPLSNIKPDLITTAMNWSLYSMEDICEREGKRKMSTQHLQDQWLKLKHEEQICGDTERKELLEQQAKELHHRLMADSKECDAREKMTCTDSLFIRCLIMLSSSCKLKNGSLRLLAADGVSLASMNLDQPFETDMFHSAIITISNTLNTGGLWMVHPRTIYDPMHLVTSLMRAFHKILEIHDFSQIGTSFFNTGTKLYCDKEWKRYFDRLSEIDQMMAAEAFGQVSSDEESPKVKQTRPGKASCNTGVSNSCLSFTGKLKKCDSCGKLEGKKNDFMKCSECLKVVYCSRECQACHWGLHKADCKVWRKQTRSG